MADVQLPQLRAAGQGSAVGELIFLRPEAGQTRELLEGGDLGELVVRHIQCGQLQAVTDGGHRGQHVFRHVQAGQIHQTAQRRQIRHGVVTQVDDLEGADGGEHAQVAHGVSAQVQLLQAGGPLQEAQGADGAAPQGQLLQSGQGLEHIHVGADGAAAEVQALEPGHALQEGQVFDLPIRQGQLLQVQQMPQVAQLNGLGRDIQLGDGPQVIGVDHRLVAEHELLLDQLLDGRIGKLHLLDDTAHGVAQNGQGTHETVVAHGDGVDLGLAALQGHGGDAGGVGGGGVLAVGGDIEGAALMGEIQADILAVEAGHKIRRGSCGPQSIQLRLDGGVRHLVEHVHRIQELVLLHIGPAQGHIQLGGSSVSDGTDQGVLCLGVVAGILVNLGQVDGHILVLSGKFIGDVIEPGCRFKMAVLGTAACLGHEKIPDRFPVVDEDIPAQADDQRHHQQKRNDPFHGFFHSILLPFRV